VALTGTVDNYATAAIAEISGAGTPTQSGANYTLNLGTLTASSSPVAIDLGVSNAATGMADLLSGSFSIANSSGAFINNEDSAFAGLAAGQADIAPAVTLTAATDGAFIETITLNAIGSNADYSSTLAPETVTINGSVAPVIVMTTGVDVVNGANNVTIDRVTQPRQRVAHRLERRAEGRSQRMRRRTAISMNVTLTSFNGRGPMASRAKGILRYLDPVRLKPCLVLGLRLGQRRCFG